LISRATAVGPSASPAKRTGPNGGRIAGTFAFDCRTGDFQVVRAKAVVLATGAAGRLGLAASG
jgi:succinate dehydrogenase/fumarate reductase flavoprotein subunit